MVEFLNRDDHSKFRYITLGFGNKFAMLSARVRASSLDGDYNSARLLPEMTAYGAAQLYSSKYYGTSGMEALRAVLSTPINMACVIFLSVTATTSLCLPFPVGARRKLRRRFGYALD